MFCEVINCFSFQLTKEVPGHVNFMGVHSKAIVLTRNLFSIYSPHGSSSDSGATVLCEVRVEFFKNAKEKRKVNRK